MASTYIRINFPISDSLRNYVLAQSGVLGVVVQASRFTIFETSLAQTQAQNLVTQIAQTKLVEYSATLPTDQQ